MKTKFFSRLFVLILSLALGFAPAAQACRDCPFPMKIGEGRWIMPGGNVELEIDQIRLPSRFEEVHIVLRDPQTGAILAQGMAKQKRGRKTVNVRLIDKAGLEVKGFVRFVDQERAEIRAEFTCESCEIVSLIKTEEEVRAELRQR